MPLMHYCLKNRWLISHARNCLSDTQWLRVEERAWGGHTEQIGNHS